ncbi:MAG: methylenetetrahydrofolate reductase [NAD(P)H] [Lachnospiraceae bacterium]|nr:methylenetetrahydrofolate reductase [NAD(P)H] [Ruminococcus sp.]MCM1275850.1 methylenetetrahydrofolate reductase [NAD(P)H] [Lachnospiraceae bacterium]
MRIPELFKENRTVLSFEIFPPKKDGSIKTVYKTLDELTDLKPDFISVTYGAGGSLPGCSTREIATAIKEKYHTESIAHLTCVNSTKADIDRVIGEFQQFGIENVLALRGDVNPDIEPKKDFAHACDLIAYMKERSSLSFSGACYPEGHPEAPSFDDDIANLKRKVDAGASHLMSQLFFDNDYFYRFLEKARAAGINVPIEAGIMPCVNAKQIQRMVTMCGASLPHKFTRLIARYGESPEAMREAGIAYAIDQIIDLAANGVDGIHLYTMNNPYVARKISDSVSRVIR